MAEKNGRCLFCEAPYLPFPGVLYYSSVFVQVWLRQNYIQGPPPSYLNEYSSEFLGSTTWEEKRNHESRNMKRSLLIMQTRRGVGAPYQFHVASSCLSPSPPRLNSPRTPVLEGFILLQVDRVLHAVIELELLKVQLHFCSCFLSFVFSFFGGPFVSSVSLSRCFF